MDYSFFTYENYTAFLLAGRLALVFILFGLLVLAYPRSIAWVPFCENVSRLSSIWLFFIAVLLLGFSYLTMPEGLP
ncbi:hypothetical protein EC844_109118 [Acinetobacter calcoaceticus]|uniref:Uncharacterized protein n=1 Tax=Acinetobacter calcoaceticus TaxID=471 RepID=A0A4R1XTT7_ACICA|nr:hypothetical protein EC844_109118 [Acinetobacter calcoaceticus]